MRAIISDIHANLEALEAVLAEIKNLGIHEIYCLGDIIGYGPNPRECIDLVMQHCQVCILGNHDQAALFDPEGFNAGAERAIFWTRSMLESGDAVNNERRWEYLGELPRMRREPDFLFVHGSARNPLNEYVFPEDIYNQRKMERIFGLVDKYCFQGHTHIPGVFRDDYSFQSPEEIGHGFECGEQKILVNVGSVGQPRDGNNKASFVVIDGPGGGHDGGGAPVGGPGGGHDGGGSPGGPGGSHGGGGGGGTPGGHSGGGHRVTFHRVPYDFEKTIAKITAISELDNFLGERLRDGR